VGRDLEHAARLRMVGGEAQGLHQAALDVLDGIVVHRAGAAPAERFFQRHAGALHHRVEEVGLVLEVPVDGTPGDFGGLRDVVKRGAGDAAALEQQFRRIEDAVAGGEGVFFGTANHDCWRAGMMDCPCWSQNGPRGSPYWQSYIHACM
jgi:hypothetical protein